MRNLLFLTIILTSIYACNSETNASKGLDASVIETDNPNIEEPIMEFKESVWDFGNIIDGESVEHTFKFKNTGSTDLVISSCAASCGCTIPSWPKEPIAPGDEGSIKVKFNSSGKSGSVSKDITITSNANPVITKLQIKVFVDKKPSN